jgi:hypothetical protein
MLNKRNTIMLNIKTIIRAVNYETAALRLLKKAAQEKNALTDPQMLIAINAKQKIGKNPNAPLLKQLLLKGLSDKLFNDHPLTEKLNQVETLLGALYNIWIKHKYLSKPMAQCLYSKLLNCIINDQVIDSTNLYDCLLEPILSNISEKAKKSQAKSLELRGLLDQAEFAKNPVEIAKIKEKYLTASKIAKASRLEKCITQDDINNLSYGLNESDRVKILNHPALEHLLTEHCTAEVSRARTSNEMDEGCEIAPELKFSRNGPDEDVTSEEPRTSLGCGAEGFD